MAMIHEKMYHSRELVRIDFRGYIQGLATTLCRSYATPRQTVTLRVDADDVHLGMDTAIPCALIVNELVSNALKYAFPEGRRGEIVIELHNIPGNQFKLVVRDNGVGLPSGLDIRNSQSLGMQIVHALTEQLDGRLEVGTTGGTSFQITFAELHYRERGIAS
jgi:two-component sensor histidine kinase